MSKKVGKPIQGMSVITHTHTHNFKFDLFVRGHCGLSPTFSGRSTPLIKPAAEPATKLLPPIKTAQAWTAV